MDGLTDADCVDLADRYRRAVHRLNALTMCSTVKGTKTALTWKDAKEQWHVNGV